ERYERLTPNFQGTGATLFHEHDLPVVVANTEHVAVVTEIEVNLPRTLLRLAGQVVDEVEAIDVVLEGLAVGLVAALLELFADVRVASHGEEGRQPVVMLDDAVRDRARLDLARPA